jgi:hypothetical protein
LVKIEVATPNKAARAASPSAADKGSDERAINGERGTGALVWFHRSVGEMRIASINRDATRKGMLWRRKQNRALSYRRPTF